MCEEFIKDVIRFFDGRNLTYVDIGAYTGKVFDLFYNSDLNIAESHLFEPNKKTFLKLEQRCCENKYENTKLYNMALSSKAMNDVALRLGNSMTKIISAEEASSLAEKDVQLTQSDTLDAILNTPETHIDILKIDVEGHEISVLKGMVQLLSDNKIDIIYMEVGINESNTQQTYYRRAEDFLSNYNFAMFKIYEQVSEWPTRSPLLRRVNIAFMNKTFAEKHSYKK